jgi:FMN phosphatase YigB (HAD superfamily)
MVKALEQRGYRIALVADGYAQSFKNMFIQHGIWDCFEAHITSDRIGASKPDPRMFNAAVRALNLSEQDHGRIVMVGNNLARDIKGANQQGIISVHLNWTPRYPKTPADDSERPDYTISEPLELLNLVEQLSDQLLAKRGRD